MSKTPVRFWVEFPEPSRTDDAVIYRCDLTWLTSRWRCLFAKGCPGIVADRPDDGCCTYGAHFSDTDDRDRVAAAAMQLSAREWQYRPADGDGCGVFTSSWLAAADPPGQPSSDKGEQSESAAVQGLPGHEAVKSSVLEHGSPHWEPVPTQSRADSDDQTSPGQTALVDGACIFLNRPDFPAGAGCALHQLAERTGQSIVATKPEVCWQLPIRRWYEQSIAPDEVSRQVVSIGEFDRAAWGPGGHDLDWYCTRDPLAHSAPLPLYLSARSELVELMGEPAYEKLAELAALFTSGRAGDWPVAARPDVEDCVGTTLARSGMAAGMQ